MDYPSREHTASRTGEPDLSTVRKILAALFLCTWLYLSHRSGGLFMEEACVSGVIVCLLMMFKTTQ